MKNLTFLALFLVGSADASVMADSPPPKTPKASTVYSERELVPVLTGFLTGLEQQQGCALELDESGPQVELKVIEKDPTSGLKMVSFYPLRSLKADGPAEVFVDRASWVNPDNFKKIKRFSLDRTYKTIRRRLEITKRRSDKADEKGESSFDVLISTITFGKSADEMQWEVVGRSDCVLK